MYENEGDDGNITESLNKYIWVTLLQKIVQSNNYGMSNKFLN